MNVQKLTALSNLRMLMVICVLAAPGFLLAQFGKKGATRALVVGISNYQDDAIPDLRFAHQDAQAFADYLIDRPVDKVKTENLKLLINEEATGGNVHSALRSLIKESQAGDKVVIYFAGHGDVETLFPDEPGHLLVYDTPSNNYSANSLSLDHVRRTVNALVKQEVQVMIVTDACHAGKLAGSEVNGAQAATSAMAEQFNSEIKILSCQSNEFSQEGEQWGSGRGVFSWYLIQGLTGMADTDQDLQVTIKELRRFLEDKVEADVAPKRQTPVFIGDGNTRIAVIDEEQLLALQKKLDPNFTPDEQSVASREPESQPDIRIDTLWTNLIQVFNRALETKKLIATDLTPEDNPESSAIEQLSKIKAAYPAKKEVATLQERLIVKLQEDAQQAINAYLKNDHEELLARWKGDLTAYQNYSTYLETAAELLGQDEYLRNHLLALSHYFKSIHLRLQFEDAYTDWDMLMKAKEEAMAARALEPRTAFIPNEIGLICYRQGQDAESLAHYREAISVSPTWAMPYNNLAIVLTKLDSLEAASAMARRALQLDSTLFGSYTALGNYFSKRGEDIEAEGTYLEGIRRNPELAAPLINYGEYWSLKGKYEIAEIWYQQALSKSHLTQRQLWDIADFYLKKNDTKRAEYYYKKILSKDPNSLWGILGMAKIDLKNGQPAKASLTFQHLQRQYQNNPLAYRYLGRLAFDLNDLENSLIYYQKLNQVPKVKADCPSLYMEGRILLSLRRLPEARTVIKKSLESCPNNVYSWYNLACVEALSNQSELAIKYLEKALQFENINLNDIRSDIDLQSIQQLPAFQDLMSRYE